MIPDQSRAIARLAQTLEGEDYVKLQNLLRIDAHLAEYPSVWQDYINERVGSVLKYSESQARDDHGRWSSGVGGGYPTWDDISEAQQSALTEYQSSHFARINGYLRSDGTQYANEGIRRDISNLDSLIDTVPPLAANTTLYRGVKGQLAQDLMSLKAGDSFTDKGYSSTSYDRNTAVSFTSFDFGSDGDGIGGNSAIITIKAPKGTKGFDVDKFFDEPFESEVILPHGTTFVVDKVEGPQVFVSVKNG